MEKSISRLAGWREWIALPALGVGQIKAKLDTGARTSALHTFNKTTFWRDGELWVRFGVHPLQRDDNKEIVCEAPVEGLRTVTNPGGRRQKRIIIRTEIELGGEVWPIDLSLTDRDEMGFRMLIGRTAMHDRLTIDPDHSYHLGKRKRIKTKKPKKKKSQKAKRKRIAAATGKKIAPQSRSNISHRKDG